jgi:RNA-directed DNA polymerase
MKNKIKLPRWETDTSGWYSIPFKDFAIELLAMQMKITAAYKSGNLPLVKKLQRELVTSDAAIHLAVKKITSTTSRNTPGLDGEVWNWPSQRLEGVVKLRYAIENIDKYKAQPLLRVWIPKAYTSELRPLGIPTVLDKAVQQLFLFSMEPVTETQMKAKLSMHSPEVLIDGDEAK